MGRFDALTQLDNKPFPQSPAPLRDIVQQPENPQARKPENLKSGNPVNLKNEKYSTLLQPTLIKQIKHYALEHDMKDYEVIQQAVQAYLEQKKSS